MSYWVTAAEVRTFANLEAATGRYADAVLGSNILAAQRMIEQRTGRIFSPETATRVFTTENRASISIPDIRSASSVVLNGTALVSGETYWLLPDRAFPSISTAIQFRSFGRLRGPSYYAVPDWFDRGLDMARYAYEQASLPNDLEITGDWGWAAPPEDVRHATKVLAAWLTKRADALLGNAVITAEGSVFDYSEMPPELNAVLATYRGGEQAVAIL